MQNDRIRINDLAKELKQNPYLLIKDLHLEGAKVSVPSNQIDKNLADKIRQKYFVKNKVTANQPIKIIKKSSLESNVKTNDKSELTNSKKERSKLSESIISKPQKQIKTQSDLKEWRIKILEGEIDVLKKRLRQTKKTLPSNLFGSLLSKLKTRIQNKELELQTLRGGKKTNSEYENCIYCNATVLMKHLYDHIEIKCPKRHTKSNDSLDNNNTQENSFVKKNPLKNDIEVKRVFWKLLPQGEWLFTELQNHFRRLSSTKKWRNKPFDEARLLKIEKNLKPNKCFVGKDEFDGYVVYCFNWTQNVILECPIYGNAIYIIKKGNFSWQEIAKATKWEARTKYSHQVKVINHSITWLERLEQNLRYEF